MNQAQEIENLKETIKEMQEQINMLTNHIMAFSPLVTEEQQKAAYEVYMEKLQNEAIHENNQRSFH